VQLASKLHATGVAHATRAMLYAKLDNLIVKIQFLLAIARRKEYKI